MLALALTVVLSQADAGTADGGSHMPFTDALYATCPQTDELAVEVDGGWVTPSSGWFLPPARAARVACLMATCERDEREDEKLLQQPPNWWVAQVASIVTAIGVGFGAGVAASQWMGTKPPPGK